MNVWVETQEVSQLIISHFLSCVLLLLSLIFSSCMLMTYGSLDSTIMCTTAIFGQTWAQVCLKHEATYNENCQYNPSSWFECRFRSWFSPENWLETPSFPDAFSFSWYMWMYHELLRRKKEYSRFRVSWLSSKLELKTSRRSLWFFSTLSVVCVCTRGSWCSFRLLTFLPQRSLSSFRYLFESDETRK